MEQRDRDCCQKKFLVPYKMDETKFDDPVVAQFENSKNVGGPV